MQGLAFTVDYRDGRPKSRMVINEAGEMMVVMLEGGKAPQDDWLPGPVDPACLAATKIISSLLVVSKKGL